MTKFIITVSCLIGLTLSAHALPKGFVYLKDYAPSIIEDLRYVTPNNFIGRNITGYYANRCILTKSAAKALAKVEQSLAKKNLQLVVYDCYRPQQAVNDFVRWSKNNSTQQKSVFYPREKKRTLFDRGYIAEYSGHSRGSTIDLSIYQKPIETKVNKMACYAKHRHLENSIDMGTNFDCLDPLSFQRAKQISKAAKVNRQLLKNVMTKNGFRPYSKEWWHFTYRREPYPRTYFNFVVR